MKIIEIKLKNNKILKLNANKYNQNNSLKHVIKLINNFENDKGDYDFKNLHKFKEKFTFIDLGANLGSVSIYIALNFPNAQIFAFEPSKNTFNDLKRNIELNNLSNRIKIFNMAISDVNGELTMNDYSEHGLSILSTTTQNQIANTEEIANKYTVRAIAFDEIFNLCKINKIDYLKCDIEGGEYLLKDIDFNRVTNASFEIHNLTHDMKGYVQMLKLAEYFNNKFEDNHFSANLCATANFDKIKAELGFNKTLIYRVKSWYYHVINNKYIIKNNSKEIINSNINKLNFFK